jgi:hypothetical protein
MDNAPTEKFFLPNTTKTIISDADDSFYVVERGGFVSQWFLASSPRHPMMYFAVTEVFRRLLEAETIGKQYVPYVTGPGALKGAFELFTKGQGTKGYAKEGIYVGFNNRTATVVGSATKQKDIVRRGSVKGRAKMGGFKKMGMQIYAEEMTESAKDERLNLTCIEHLYHLSQRPSFYTM